jgi:SnoaL-like domain
MNSHPYREAYEAHDLDRLESLLADDVVFHSAIITEQGFEGRGSVAAFLAIVLDMFEDNQFTHEFGDERSHLLVANAHVLGKPVKTTTLLELDADGKIREIWVMVRPLRGLVAVVEAAGLPLAKGREAAVRELSKQLADLAEVAESAGAGLTEELNRSTT